MALATREKINCHNTLCALANFQNHQKHAKANTGDARQAEGEGARQPCRRVGNECDRGGRQHEAGDLGGFRRALGDERIDHRDKGREQAGQRGGDPHLAQDKAW